MTDQLHRCLCCLVEHKKKDNYVFDAAEEKWMKARNKARSRESDWAKFYRYEEANKSLKQAPAVVFMGNSITDTWAKTRPEFFTSHNYAGRGISGQTSSHMLVRFQEDVIALHPKAVVILAGINDLARNKRRRPLHSVCSAGIPLSVEQEHISWRGHRKAQRHVERICQSQRHNIYRLLLENGGQPRRIARQTDTRRRTSHSGGV